MAVYVKGVKRGTEALQAGDPVAGAARHRQPQQRRRGRGGLSAPDGHRGWAGCGRGWRKFRWARTMPLHKDKLMCARYWMERLMPECPMLLERIQAGLQDIALRVRSAFTPGYTVARNDSESVLSESEGGNFYVFGTVNGTPIRFLIDTGASDIVLSPSDARLIGIPTENLDYSRIYGTANGVGHGAMATVSRLTVGPISFSDVPVSINQAPMDSSLLGMTFLRRLKSFSIRNHRLYLRWR
jgi:clan AA aspartic protease (TIGR02281 family)